MAVQRVWFPHIPDGTIDGRDRLRQGIGYGGITAFATVVGRAFESIIVKTLIFHSNIIKSFIAESIVVKNLTFHSKIEN